MDEKLAVWEERLRSSEERVIAQLQAFCMAKYSELVRAADNSASAADIIRLKSEQQVSGRLDELRSVLKDVQASQQAHQDDAFRVQKSAESLLGRVSEEVTASERKVLAEVGSASDTLQATLEKRMNEERLEIDIAVSAAVSAVHDHASREALSIRSEIQGWGQHIDAAAKTSAAAVQQVSLHQREFETKVAAQLLTLHEQQTQHHATLTSVEERVEGIAIRLQEAIQNSNRVEAETRSSLTDFAARLERRDQMVQKEISGISSSLREGISVTNSTFAQRLDANDDAVQSALTKVQQLSQEANEVARVQITDLRQEYDALRSESSRSLLSMQQQLASDVKSLHAEIAVATQHRHRFEEDLSGRIRAHDERMAQSQSATERSLAEHAASVNVRVDELHKQVSSASETSTRTLQRQWEQKMAVIENTTSVLDSRIDDLQKSLQAAVISLQASQKEAQVSAQQALESAANDRSTLAHSWSDKFKSFSDEVNASVSGFRTSLVDRMTREESNRAFADDALRRSLTETTENVSLSFASRLELFEKHIAKEFDKASTSRDTLDERLRGEIASAKVYLQGISSSLETRISELQQESNNKHISSDQSHRRSTESYATLETRLSKSVDELRALIRGEELSRQHAYDAVSQRLDEEKRFRIEQATNAADQQMQLMQQTQSALSDIESQLVTRIREVARAQKEGLSETELLIGSRIASSVSPLQFAIEGLRSDVDVHMKQLLVSGSSAGPSVSNDATTLRSAFIEGLAKLRGDSEAQWLWTRDTLEGHLLKIETYQRQEEAQRQQRSSQLHDSLHRRDETFQHDLSNVRTLLGDIQSAQSLQNTSVTHDILSMKSTIASLSDSTAIRVQEATDALTLKLTEAIRKETISHDQSLADLRQSLLDTETKLTGSISLLKQGMETETQRLDAVEEQVVHTHRLSQEQHALILTQLQKSEATMISQFSSRSSASEELLQKKSDTLRQEFAAAKQLYQALIADSSIRFSDVLNETKEWFQGHINHLTGELRHTKDDFGIECGNIRKDLAVAVNTAEIEAAHVRRDLGLELENTKSQTMTQFETQHKEILAITAQIVTEKTERNTSIAGAVSHIEKSVSLVHAETQESQRNVNKQLAQIQNKLMNAMIALDDRAVKAESAWFDAQRNMSVSSDKMREELQQIQQDQRQWQTTNSEYIAREISTAIDFRQDQERKITEMLATEANDRKTSLHSLELNLSAKQEALRKSLSDLQKDLETNSRLQSAEMVSLSSQLAQFNTSARTLITEMKTESSKALDEVQRHVSQQIDDVALRLRHSDESLGAMRVAMTKSVDEVRQTSRDHVCEETEKLRTLLDNSLNSARETYSTKVSALSSKFTEFEFAQSKYVLIRHMFSKGDRKLEESKIQLEEQLSTELQTTARAARSLQEAIKDEIRNRTVANDNMKRLQDELSDRVATVDLGYQQAMASIRSEMAGQEERMAQSLLDNNSENDNLRQSIKTSLVAVDRMASQALNDSNRLEETLVTFTTQTNRRLESLQAQTDHLAGTIDETVQSETTVRQESFDMLHAAITAVSKDTEKLRSTVARVVEQSVGSNDKMEHKLQTLSAELKIEAGKRIQEIASMQDAVSSYAKREMKDIGDHCQTMIKQAFAQVEHCTRTITDLEGSLQSETSARALLASKLTKMVERQVSHLSDDVRARTQNLEKALSENAAQNAKSHKILMGRVQAAEESTSRMLTNRSQFEQQWFSARAQDSDAIVSRMEELKEIVSQRIAAAQHYADEVRVSLDGRLTNLRDAMASVEERSRHLCDGVLNAVAQEAQERKLHIEGLSQVVGQVRDDATGARINSMDTEARMNASVTALAMEMRNTPLTSIAPSPSLSRMRSEGSLLTQDRLLGTPSRSSVFSESSLGPLDYPPAASEDPLDIAVSNVLQSMKFSFRIQFIRLAQGLYMTDKQKVNVSLGGPNDSLVLVRKGGGFETLQVFLSKLYAPQIAATRSLGSSRSRTKI